MKALFWTPPWPSQGQLLFHHNSVQKNLVAQANLLARRGFDVDFVLCSTYGDVKPKLDKAVRVVSIDLKEAASWVGGIDPVERLYVSADDPLCDVIDAGLRPHLARRYDVVLLWETSVPFLERAYPEALFLHQMPGTFSRSPYPHTIVLDPVGLFRHGGLNQLAGDILAVPTAAGGSPLLADFMAKARASIKALQPFDRSMLDPKRRFASLTLVPLQSSGHYAFQADTRYRTQLDFALDVLARGSPEAGYVFTHYRSSSIHELTMTAKLRNSLAQAFPNVIFSPEFDKISTSSQYLLPLVDSVWSCSSSVGLQALMFDRSLLVDQPTFLLPFADASIEQRGMSPERRRDTVLDFILRRQQPLIQLVTTDEGFLVATIEDMLGRKRRGAAGLDLFPDYPAIKADYAETLQRAFRVEEAARSVRGIEPRPSGTPRLLQSFEKSAASSRVAVISFDLFDTLVSRPVETPAGVWKFMESEALAISDGLAVDFPATRAAAEVAVREACRQGEITFEAIYALLAEQYGLTEDMKQRLMACEIALERRFLTARPLGLQLWLAALETGKPIVVVSDMYLPTDAIRAILDDHGYAPCEDVFVSSEWGARKADGTLFDVVVERLGVSGKSILHVGDNRISDGKMAKSRGLRTVHVPSARATMFDNPHYVAAYGPRAEDGRARAAIAGLTARALFDIQPDISNGHSHFQGKPYNLGYAGLGPVIAGYMLWLHQEALGDKLSDLFFLSRDGWVMMQVYEALLAGRADALPARYVYASRRATRVPGLRDAADIDRLAVQPFHPGGTASALLFARFGVSASDVPADAWVRSGLSGPAAVLDEIGGRAAFRTLCRLAKDPILAVAARERDIYLRYLDETGLASATNPGIIDLGWRGNIQMSLGQLLGRPLKGYYYATLQGVERLETGGNSFAGYAGNMITAGHPSSLAKFRHLVEFLVCHVERSVSHMEEADGSFRPVFAAEADAPKRQAFIAEVHRGAIAFARDLRAAFGHSADPIAIDPFVGERCFRSFVTKPAYADAALLAGQGFDDEFGGFSSKFVVHPDDAAEAPNTVWPIGTLAFHSKAGGSRLAAIRGGLTVGARYALRYARLGVKYAWPNRIATSTKR